MLKKSSILVSAAATFIGVWRGLIWLIDWIGRGQVISDITAMAWVGPMISVLNGIPPWVSLALLVLGLLGLYFSLRGTTSGAGATAAVREKDAPPSVAGDNNIVSFNQSGNAQTAHTIINPPPADPTLKKISFEQVRDPSGRYVATAIVGIDSARLPSQIEITIKADTMISADIRPRNRSGFMSSSWNDAPNVYRVLIPSPSREWVITVITAQKVNVGITYAF